MLTGETKKECFVYQHLDNNNKVFYVGHGSKRRPYDKYGRSEAWNKKANKGYTIKIIDILPKKQAFELEKKIQTEIGLDNLVNQNIGCSFIHTKESKANISKSNKGKKHTKETRAKMSLSKQNPTDEARKNMALGQKGRKHSEETKNKMSISASKRWQKANEIRNKQLEDEKA